jgi:signal transduction histidine kinase
VLEHGIRALGADTCLVYTATDGDLALIGHHGLPPEVATALAAVRRLDEMPGLSKLRDGSPVFTETAAEYRATFPILAQRSPRGGPCAAWAVPLVAAGVPVGVIAMGYLAERAFAPEERSFITTFARQCAFALERTRLYEQQRIANEQLRAMAEEARAAVRARDDFLSDASHELNTPLAAVKLHLGRLLRHPPPPDVMRERLAMVDKQVDRLTVLVNELLDVSRLRAGRFELHREEFELGALVRDIGERLDPSRLELELDEAVGSWDRSRLEQVITNLISNALKYGEGRPVAVRLVVEGDAVLTVSDQGIGIASEDQTRIFDRFERAVSGQRFNGLGLGLWISRRIVEAHGGSIGVTSREGVGSTFTVRLPTA